MQPTGCRIAGLAVKCAVLCALVMMAGPLQVPVAAATNNPALFAQAQALVTSDTATTGELQAKRHTLAVGRDPLNAIINAGSVEGQSLRAELGALSMATREGARELPQIAKSREDLEDAVAVAETPLRAAQAALEQSNVLIAALDVRIRSLLTERLLLWGPRCYGNWRICCGRPP